MALGVGILLPDLPNVDVIEGHQGVCGSNTGHQSGVGPCPPETLDELQMVLGSLWLACGLPAAPADTSSINAKERLFQQSHDKKIESPKQTVLEFI